MRWLSHCSVDALVGSRSKVIARGWLGLALSCVMACAEKTDPTQVIVTVDADEALRPSVLHLGLQLEGVSTDDKTQPVDLPRTIPAKWPVKFVLTPRNGDARRRYRLTITAVRRGGRGLVELTFASGYIEHETRYVHLELSSRCSANASTLTRDVFRFGRTPETALRVTCGAEDEDAGMRDTDASMPPDEMMQGEPDAGTPTTRPDAGGGDSGPTGCDLDCASDRTCVLANGEPKCACASGWVERDGECEAATACAEFYCEQDCVVVDDEPECRCVPGSKLNSDGKTCYRPTWLPLESVAPSLPGTLPAPGFDAVKVAIAASGAAAVAWSRIENESYVLYQARFQRGTGWMQSSASEPAAMSNNYRPDLALNGDGYAFATWTRSAPEPDRAIVSRSSPGYPWEAEVVSTGAYAAASPLIAADAAGNAVTVWWQIEQGMPALWSSSTAKNQEWSAPAIVQPSVMNAAAYPLLLEMNEAGRALIVWDPPPAGTFTPVVASFRDESGNWLAAEAFDSFYFELQIEGGVADYRGDVAAVAAELPMSMIDFELRASVHRQGQGWTEPHLLPTINARTYSYAPDIAVSPTGSVFVVWSQGTLAAQEVFAARHDPASGWSPSRKIGEGRLPHVAALSDGSAIAVWDVPARKQIWFSRYIPGSDIWLGQDIVHAGVEVKSEIDLAAEGERAILAFVGTDGTRETLWSAQFE